MDSGVQEKEVIPQYPVPYSKLSKSKKRIIRRSKIRQKIRLRKLLASGIITGPTDITTNKNDLHQVNNIEEDGDIKPDLNQIHIPLDKDIILVKDSSKQHVIVKTERRGDDEKNHANPCHNIMDNDSNDIIESLNETLVKVEPEDEGSSFKLGITPTNSNSTANRNAEELMNLVFNSKEEDMSKIRGMIVAHVIRNEIRRGSSRSDLRAVRLVAKSWLQDASKYLLESGQPLYKITLTPENSLWTSPKMPLNGGKLLDRFTSAITSPTRLEIQIPLFSLKIQPHFFLAENHQSFSNFLAGCASGFLELEICFPKTGGSMIFLFPGVNLNFPNLRKLTISFYGFNLKVAEEHYRCLNSEGSLSVSLYLIQSILSGADKLKELNFPPLSHLMESPLQVEIRHLTFPPTIMSLNLNSIWNSSKLGSLLNYDLPNLHILKFTISNEQYAKDLISKVLEKFRGSLRKLAINEPLSFPSGGKPLSLFRIPVMEKLQCFELTTRFTGREDENHPLQHHLPNLKFLKLYNQSIDQIQTWTKFSTFSSVMSLHLNLIAGSGKLHLLNLNKHFPNLRVLGVGLRDLPVTEGLQQIFRHMIQLNVLDIWIHSGSDYGNSDHWDSLLTGIPLGMLAALRANPEFWPSVKLSGDNEPSIRKLSELHTLMLRCHPTVTTPGKPLISDLAFIFGFMQMPKLKRLRLETRFRASAKMTRAWADLGLILET